MPDLDLDLLLQEHSPEHPSGPDLEYDPAFVAMEQAAQAKPEQQYGSTVIPGEPPDWREAESKALDVLGRSHDLRAAVFLANAVLVEHGLEPFSTVLALLRGYVEKFWETVNPPLDPDDDNDPTMRVNALMGLCDASTTIYYLSHTPLAQVPAIGQFSLFDWKVASGELEWPANADSPAPDTAIINGAFRECNFDTLASRLNAARSGLENATRIEELVTDYVGAANACNFDALVRELKGIVKLLEDQHGKREESAPAAPEAEPVATAGEAPAEGLGAAPAAAKSFVSVADMTITTRRDAIQALEKVCQYFESYEPSSPLPLLLRRARRLSNKSFLEIIRDISPDGIHQVEALGGLDDTLNDSSDSYASSPPPAPPAPPPSPSDSY